MKNKCKSCLSLKASDLDKPQLSIATFKRQYIITKSLPLSRRQHDDNGWTLKIVSCPKIPISSCLFCFPKYHVPNTSSVIYGCFGLHNHLTR